MSWNYLMIADVASLNFVLYVHKRAVTLLDKINEVYRSVCSLARGRSKKIVTNVSAISSRTSRVCKVKRNFVLYLSLHVLHEIFRLFLASCVKPDNASQLKFNIFVEISFRHLFLLQLKVTF